MATRHAQNLSRFVGITLLANKQFIKMHGQHKLSWAGTLITLGIIFGDIGTSPLYVMKEIMGDAPINRETIFGAISLIFWTLTFQTTLKYVLLTLRADNNGEGGIFSLYTLVRRRGRWLLFPAIIGGAAMLADGMITPPISVMAAIEGMGKVLHLDEAGPSQAMRDSVALTRLLTLSEANTPVEFKEDSVAVRSALELLHPRLANLDPEHPGRWIFIGITLAILSLLFFTQQFGTSFVGKGFGPIMLLWFSMLAALGIAEILKMPEVFQALSPHHGLMLLYKSPKALWILSAVFLCTTGAEALYADLGHCGRQNIEMAWIFVKASLVLNYLGQAVWILSFEGHHMPDNPFFGIIPDWFRWPGVILATLATIVASQALISGSFTLVSEAIRLGLLPKMTVRFPSTFKGQIYIPAVALFLWVGCSGVTLFFKESGAMGAAYGLAIVFAMLSTTILLSNWLIIKRVPSPLVWGFLVFYLLIEGGFLAANALKFKEGGYVTLIAATLMFGVMWIWVKAKKIRQRYGDEVKINDYLDQLIRLSNDETVPKCATNLVFMSNVKSSKRVEDKIMYSILQTQPKRADVYWFAHIQTTDEPYTTEYEVNVIAPNDVYKVVFRLGFRVQQRMNLFMKKVVEELAESGELDVTSPYHSSSKGYPTGDFRFVIIQEFLSNENELPWFEKIVLDIYLSIKGWVSSPKNWFGLDADSVVIESAPILLNPARDVRLTRLANRKKKRVEEE